MANARKCDRCGNYYEHNVRTITPSGGFLGKVSTLTYRGVETNNIYDLCDDCMEKFMSFIHGVDLKGE